MGHPAALNLSIPSDRFNAGLHIGSQKVQHRLQANGVGLGKNLKTYVIHIDNNSIFFRFSLSTGNTCNAVHWKIFFETFFFPPPPPQHLYIFLHDQMSQFPICLGTMPIFQFILIFLLFSINCPLKRDFLDHSTNNVVQQCGQFLLGF